MVVTSLDYANHSQIKNFVKRMPEKFVVIPNGVDMEHFKPGPYPEYLAAKHNLTGRKVILFVGSLDSAHYFKGVNYLITALQQLKRDDTSLVIVGEGDLRYSYQELVESYGLGDKVIFVPDAGYNQLPDYYRLADCLVLPSTDKSEAFGVVLVEAMATAKPIIASDLPGVRSVVGQHTQHGLLAKPGDAVNLARQIERLLKNKELSEQCGRNGLEAVKQQYAWPVIATEFESLYKQINPKINEGTGHK